MLDPHGNKKGQLLRVEILTVHLAAKTMAEFEPSQSIKSTAKVVKSLFLISIEQLRIDVPPLQGVAQIMTTFAPLIVVVGAATLLGAYAAKMLIGDENRPLPTEFLARTLS